MSSNRSKLQYIHDRKKTKCYMLSTLIGHDLKSKVFVFEFETFAVNRHFYAQYLT